MGALEDRLRAPSIPVGFLEDVLAAARHRELDIDAVLEAQGLSSGQLAVPGLRISIDLYGRVLRGLGAATGDAFYGFLSRPVPVRAFDVFAQGLVGCRNLSDVVAHANDFYGLFTDELRWRLEPAKDHVALIADLQPAWPIDYRFVIQSLLLMPMRVFEWMFGGAIEVAGVDFWMPSCLARGARSPRC